MNIRKHGTFQVVLWRPTFVVLGSDSATVENTENEAGMRSKIVCHETIPLAIAVGGMAEFTINGRETIVTDMIRNEFGAWAARGRISIHTVANWATAALLPRVREGILADPEVQQHISLLVAICTRGKADSAQIHIADAVTFPDVSINRTYILPPRTLAQWAEKRFGAKSGDPCGFRLTEPSAVATHAKRIIDDAIAAEQKLAVSRPAQCGGRAELVLVDSNGVSIASWNSTEPNSLPRFRHCTVDKPVADIPTAQTLARFDALVRDMDLKLGDGFPLKQEAEIIRAYYDDRARFGAEQIQAKWQPRDLEFRLARVSLERFVDATEALKGLPGLKRLLKDIVSGSIAQDFVPSSAKDKLYELELAATLKRAGFDVELREPDIVATGNGLGKPLAIACKYPSSRGQIHEHISKGYQQITKQTLEGAVAIGWDLIIGKEQRLHGMLDFSKGSRPPEDILHQRLVKEIQKLELERNKDYPSERPLDGLIITASIAAMDRDSVSLTFLNVYLLGCLPGNLLKADLETVMMQIEAIKP